VVITFLLVVTGSPPFGPPRSIHPFDKTERDRGAGTIRAPWPYLSNRLAVSPDGKTIFVQRQAYSNDLMLIENFT